MKPIVSVVLPVFNCEYYIKEAISSVLDQTFKDFELIIIDDKSTDNTVEVIKSFKDHRIRLFLNKKNIGRAGSDNFALSVIQGKYLAKMDGDDICHPQRLEKQVDILERNSLINVVGTWIQSIGKSKFLHKYPSESTDLKCKIILGIPLGNPSIMFRSELFLSNRMEYDSLLRQAEDYDFFARYLDQLNMSVVSEPLVYYRTYSNDLKQNVIDERRATVKAIRRKFLDSWGVPLTEYEYDILDMIYNLDKSLVKLKLNIVEQVFNKIVLHNKENKFFSQEPLKRFLAQRLFYVCYHCQQRKFGSVLLYYRSYLSRYQDISAKLTLKFLLKGFMKL